MEWRQSTNEVFVIKTIDTPQIEVNTIDTYQIDPLNNEENSVKLVRGPRGRFVAGNRESVGNKGGRPRDITMSDIVEDRISINQLMDNFTDGDDRATKAFLKLLDGKLK